jgi:hypothetical protein
MPKRASSAPPDPDSLVRQQAGTYRTPDERFEVREADQGWFLVDANQTDDFGQPLVRGPFPTLKAVRTALPDARTGAPAPARSRPAAKPAAPATAKPKARKPAPPPPPPSWIDELPAADASAVRRMVKALEAEGVERAEQLVRRDRQGMSPVIAETLIRKALDALLDGATDEERRLVARAVELLASGSREGPGGLPGWALVEIGPQPEPPNRRLRPSVD